MTIVSNIRKNIMGTTSFTAKIKGSRKDQDFIIYPMNSETEVISIQSDTRFGKVEIESGNVLLTKAHPNGANSWHMSTDTLVEDTIENFEELKDFIRKTVGSLVGDSIVKSDNSFADGI